MKLDKMIGIVQKFLKYHNDIFIQSLLVNECKIEDKTKLKDLYKKIKKGEVKLLNESFYQ